MTLNCVTLYMFATVWFSEMSQRTIAPWWTFRGTAHPLLVLRTSCHGNCTASAHKNKSLTVHRHLSQHSTYTTPSSSSIYRGEKQKIPRWSSGKPRRVRDERSQSPQRRACCWECPRRRAQHCGSSAGPQTRRRGSEEAQVPEESGGQQARHGGGPARTEWTHHAGGCSRTAGGYARFGSPVVNVFLQPRWCSFLDSGSTAYCKQTLIDYVHMAQFTFRPLIHA